MSDDSIRFDNSLESLMPRTGALNVLAARARCGLDESIELRRRLELSRKN